MVASPRPPTGASVRVARPRRRAALVATLVDARRAVYGAVPSPPTLEDVYFAVEARIAAAEGRDLTPRSTDVLSRSAQVTP